jgi:hypothetical protein
VKHREPMKLRHRLSPVPGILAGLLALAFLPWANAGDLSPSPRKKLIEVGWDIPDTAFLRGHHPEMERTAPFDGLNFYVTAAKPEGGRADSLKIWDGQPWQRTWFTNAIADLKACRFTKFTDNFLRIDATPGTLDWGDDIAWSNLAQKLAICAWVARAGGAKGVCLDLEGYGVKSFKFDPAKKVSFAATSTLARKRGVEVMRAIASEFPGQVLFTYWLNSINTKAGRASNPEAILAAEAYGLQPAFINGLLDAAPPEMKLVDGCEDGYYKDSDHEYQVAAADMRQWHGPVARLIAPENRRKWRAQGQAAFGFYLDMYLNPQGHQYYFPPLDGSRLKRLQHNLIAARDAADEYVWIYGEQCRWWGNWELNDWFRETVKKTAGQGRHWEDAIPGLTWVIQSVRDPESATREEIAKRRAAGTLHNLTRNGDFSETTPDRKRPAEWNTWQDEGSKGRFEFDAAVGGGAAKATQVKDGCFLQSHNAKPGDTYTLQAECRSTGATLPGLMVRWQRADGSWVRWDADITFCFSGSRDGWAQAFGAVTVPDNAEKLVVLLIVKQQLADEDACWFDNVELYQLGGANPAVPSNLLSATPVPAAAPPPEFPLKVSEDHRYLVDQRGTPFLYHADTAWMLFLKLAETEAADYLAARQAQGFNTIQVQLTGFLGTTNRSGELPFAGTPLEQDFERPNEGFFAHVDKVVAQAEKLGLLLAVAPTWSGCCGEGWAGTAKNGAVKPLNRNGAAKTRALGQYLGQRYGRFANLMWILGGDNDPNNAREEIRALGLGLKDTAPRQLITYHAASSHSSMDVWPAAEPWLDISMVYTYFRGFNKAWNKNQPDVYEVSHAEFAKSPIRPFFLGESTYEGEHSAWGSALQVRKQAYWCVLGGGFGHAYGSPNWNFPKNWREFMELPGATSLKRFRSLFESRPWWNLRPDTLNVVAVEGRGAFATNDCAVTARAVDGSFAVAYLPTKRALTIDLAQLTGERIVAWWFNPRTGGATRIGEFTGKKRQAFEPSDDGDWVLVLDDSADSFPSPGTPGLNK